MKVFVAADRNADGEISVHARREEAEAEAQRRAGGSGHWTDTSIPGCRQIAGPKATVRVAERPVGGNPLGEFPGEGV